MNRKKFFLWLLIVVILIAVGVWKALWGSGVIQTSGEFSIESGEAATHVWQNLLDQEFVTRKLPLRFYGWRLQAAANLKAGQYQLETGETIQQVVARFVAGDTDPNEVSITYPEGFTLDQIAERTAARGIGTKQNFLAAATPQQYLQQHPYLGDIPTSRGLEGYLFPDTYRVFPDDQPADVIARMLANFAEKFSPELREEATASGRTLDEIVIMASIIEREVISDDDMARVSGVLWKRFDENSGLGADATIRYVLDKWDGALTVDDLQIDSPYNTRRYAGLPPGPISNPGLRALIAAVRPEESEYYYYLSTPTGETIFAKTNEEHNANKAKYLR